MGLGIEKPFDLESLNENIDDLIAEQMAAHKSNPERMTISAVHTLLSVSESAIRHLTAELGEYFSPPYVKGETRLFNKSSIIQVARLLNYLHATQVQYAGLKKFLEANPSYLVKGIIENNLDNNVAGATYVPKSTDENHNEDIRRTIKQSLEDISKLQESINIMQKNAL